MKDTTRIHLLGKIISGNEVVKERMRREKEYIFESFPVNAKTLIDEKLENGWTVEREFKTTIRLKKKKELDVYFEDRVWSIFAKLGFKFLNKDRHFHLPYDKNNDSLTQQIDVFIKDDETVLLIECKTTKTNKLGDFKTDLEAMSGKMEGLINSVKQLFPGEKLKIKYILATHGYDLSVPDINRLENLKGEHFDEDVINYYFDLFKQLGLAAKYQLLGSIFHGSEIPELDNLVPTVKGKMGKHTYYSFSIEPEKLLKIGYVLHRNKANDNMMPTYQRIIKKHRLESINEFIDEKGGYFPNSIIISIDSGGKKMTFDRANTQVKTAISEVGILHLPKKYRSAFIIDGQHRLYGYANSKYKSSNSIPVVAFVDLEREEQIKLFMEINENQKAVSKNLRLTLNADLLWTSNIQADRIKALCSRIAIYLGERRSSPLFDKIAIGEDKKIITSEAVVDALKNSNFLGKLSKNEFDKIGTFYKGDLDSAYEGLAEYLAASFSYLKENLEDEWQKDNSLLLINKGIYAIIRILSDIADHLLAQNIINNSFKTHEIINESKHYLDPVIKFFKNVSAEKSQDLKSTYGGGGNTKYWRTLQIAIKEVINNFEPEGLAEYLKKEEKEYNDEAFSLIRNIETFIKKDIRLKLNKEYGEFWFEDGVPPKIQGDAVVLAQEKKRESKEEVDPWDCLYIPHYREIVMKNWRDTFEKEYSWLSGGKKNGNKEEKTVWMYELSKIRNDVVHSYYVSKEKIEFLREINDWMHKKVAIKQAEVFS